jgi:hypothetical protein
LGEFNLDDELSEEDSDIEDEKLQSLKGLSNEGYGTNEDDGQKGVGGVRKDEKIDTGAKPFSLERVFGGLKLDCIEAMAKTDELDNGEIKGKKYVDFEGIDRT